MSASNQSWESPNATPIVASGMENWYAVHTRARHERAVVQRLREQGVTTFLPLVTEVHRWSDRRKSVELPLFGCYVFVKLAPTGEERLRVLRIDGVFKFVGSRRIGNSNRGSANRGGSNPGRTANTVECPSISPDRAAGASPWRRSRWRRRHSALSK